MNALCAPIFVGGVDAGDTVVVRIHGVVVAEQGVSCLVRPPGETAAPMPGRADRRSATPCEAPGWIARSTSADAAERQGGRMIEILSHLFPRPASSLAELRVQIDRAQARIAEIGYAASGSIEREAELRMRNRELQEALRREIARLRAAESIRAAAPRR